MKYLVSETERRTNLYVVEAKNETDAWEQVANGLPELIPTRVIEEERTICEVKRKAESSRKVSK